MILVGMVGMGKNKEEQLLKFRTKTVLTIK
jgi:hypothetical protein